MVNLLLTCGDSFGCGAGLPLDVCFEKSFAGIVAEHFKLPQQVYARSGCCNFTIYLQVIKLIERFNRDPNFRPFVLITATHHSRMFIPLTDGTKYKKPDLKYVNYESYPPFSHIGSDGEPRKVEFKTEETKYITETISNLTEYQAGRVPNLHKLFTDIHKEKFDALKYYFNELYDDGTKHEYDKALYASIHLLLEQLNIPHLIIDNSNHNLVDKPEFLPLNWGTYTSQYPDEYGSGHCNEEGNRLVGERVIEHIKKHDLL